MSDSDVDPQNFMDVPSDGPPRKRRKRTAKGSDAQVVVQDPAVEARGLINDLNSANDAYIASLQQEAKTGLVSDYAARQMSTAQLTLDTILRRPDLWRVLVDDDHRILQVFRRLLTCHKKRVRTRDPNGGPDVVSPPTSIPPPVNVIRLIFRFLSTVKLDPLDGQGPQPQNKKWQKWPGLDRTAVAESQLGFTLETICNCPELEAPELKVAAAKLLTTFSDYLKPADVGRAARVRARTLERRAAELAAAAESAAGDDIMTGIPAVFRPVLTAEDVNAGVDAQHIANLAAQNRMQAGFTPFPERRAAALVAPASTYDPKKNTASVVVCTHQRVHCD